MNSISYSKETAEYIKQNNITEENPKIFYGLTPADRYECSCQKLIRKMYDVVGGGGKSYYVECDHKRTGYNQYNITCKKCGSTVAKVWAKDTSLEDYFDLHYVCTLDDVGWHGALSLNISPIDGRIGIECACGNDTRDFRANNTLPPLTLKEKIEETSAGRDFGKSSSKFKVERTRQ